MIFSDGYGIEEFPSKNKIIITLPQTMKTATNSVEGILERKEKLTDTELIAILTMAKMCYEQFKGEH